jgi:hypothetical protein
MDQPLTHDATANALRAKALDSEPTGAVGSTMVVGIPDPGPSHLGKPVGAVIAAAKVLRTLHASERPLTASDVGRASDHRGLGAALRGD